MFKVLLLSLGFFSLSASAAKGVQRKAFAAHDRHLTIEAWDDDLLHFEYSTGSGGPIWVSPMVNKRDYSGASSFSATDSAVETAELRVSVERESLCVAVFDKARSVNLNRVCPASSITSSWKGLSIDSPRTKNVYGLGQYLTNPGTADGDWLGRIWDPTVSTHGNALRPFNGGANSYALFPIAYALGEGREAYALFVDQVYKQMWSLNQSPWKVEMYGDQIRWFVLSGNDLADLRRDYMELTGRPPVPPKNIFGLWVSEFGYENFGEVYEDLVSLENDGFPVDGFALDIQWFGGRFYNRGDDTRGSRFGTLRFDDSKFGNFEHEIKHLRWGRGIRLMPIEESYVSKFLPEHSELERRGLMARSCPYGAPTYLDANPWWGVGGMIDWTNPAAGDYWHDTKRQYLIRLGLTHHWTDLGEPEMYDERSCYHGFPELGKHGHPDIHNVYNLRWAESIARGYERHKVIDRPFILSRSGTSGVQRTGAGMWSGDIAANMGALTAHLNSQMHMSLSGVDYYGSDIGGFHRRPDTLDGDPNELYTQWFANSALFDFPIRAHVWNLANNLETAPSKIGDKKSNLSNLLLRYLLSPYYYSLAHQAYRTGEPVVPPVVYWYPEDEKVRTQGNLKMIGRDLLAAIVARYGETTRDVYLPKGKWMNFHTLEWHDSRGETIRDVPVWGNGVLRLPLFARAGAILPLKVVDANTRNLSGFRKDGSRLDDLGLRVVSDASPSRFNLVEDDGDTVAYQSGKVAETVISQRQSNGAAIVEIAATRGIYQGMPTSRVVRLELLLEKGTATAVELNGAALPRCEKEAVNGCWASTNGRVAVRTNPLPLSDKKTFAIRFR